MSQDTLEKYTQLFQQIRENSKNILHGIQLECISKLVFFGGVQRKLIPELQIRDVFNRDGKALDEITTKSKKVIDFNDEMKLALEDYFNDLKSCCSSFINRTEPLFRNYRTERKLRLHWEKLGTGYTQIKRDGDLYKKEQEQRRYEGNIRISQDSDSADDHVDMIVDIDDDRWN